MEAIEDKQIISKEAGQMYSAQSAGKPTLKSTTKPPALKDDGYCSDTAYYGTIVWQEAQIVQKFHSQLAAGQKWVPCLTTILTMVWPQHG